MNISRAMERQVVSRLAPLGFTIMSKDLEPSARRKEGSSFRRIHEGREQVIVIGRRKFGRSLGLNIGAERSDGSYEYMLWDKLGLDPKLLGYNSQDTLEDVLRSIMSFVETKALPWFDVLR